MTALSSGGSLTGARQRSLPASPGTLSCGWRARRLPPREAATSFFRKIDAAPRQGHATVRPVWLAARLPPASHRPSRSFRVGPRPAGMQLVGIRDGLPARRRFARFSASGAPPANPRMQFIERRMSAEPSVSRPSRCGQGASSRRSAPAALATKSKAGHRPLRCPRETAFASAGWQAQAHMMSVSALALEALSAFQSSGRGCHGKDAGHGLAQRPWTPVVSR